MQLINVMYFSAHIRYIFQSSGYKVDPLQKNLGSFYMELLNEEKEDFCIEFIFQMFITINLCLYCFDFLMAENSLITGRCFSCLYEQNS